MRSILPIAALCAAISLCVAAPALARPVKVSVSNVTVTAGKPAEFHFIVAPSTVKSGIVVFKVTNKGALAHDFSICSASSTKLANSCRGRTTKQISPNSSDTLRVTITRKGTYEYLCTVPGHAAGGMKGFIKVT